MSDDSYEPVKMPAAFAGRKVGIGKHQAVHHQTLEAVVARLDAAGDREAADVIVWLTWWRNIADNRAHMFGQEFLKRGGKA